MNDLLELSDGGTAAFLDRAFELTTKDKAVYVRILYPDGRSITGAVPMPAGVRTKAGLITKLPRVVQ